MGTAGPGGIVGLRVLDETHVLAGLALEGGLSKVAPARLDSPTSNEPQGQGLDQACVLLWMALRDGWVDCG